jgi:hypothetical protein
MMASNTPDLYTVNILLKPVKTTENIIKVEYTNYNEQIAHRNTWDKRGEGLKLDSRTHKEC